MRKHDFITFIEGALDEGKTATEAFIEFGRTFREESVNLVGTEGKKNWRASFDNVYRQVTESREMQQSQGPLFAAFFALVRRRGEFTTRLLKAIDEVQARTKAADPPESTEDMLEVVELYNDIETAAQSLDTCDDDKRATTFINRLLEADPVLEDFREEAKELYPGKIQDA